MKKLHFLFISVRLVLVLISAHVERNSVSHRRDFCLTLSVNKLYRYLFDMRFGNPFENINFNNAKQDI